MEAFAQWNEVFSYSSVILSAIYIESTHNWATSLVPSDASISSCIEQLTGHAGHNIKSPIVILF